MVQEVRGEAGWVFVTMHTTLWSGYGRGAKCLNLHSYSFCGWSQIF